MTDDLDTSAAVKAYMGQQDQVVARAAVSAAAGTSGDLEAELRAASARTGVPMSSARAMPEVVKRRAAIGDTMDAVQRFPSTLAYLADEGNARLAHDDVDVLTSIEAALGATARYLTSSDAKKPGLVTDVGAGIYQASRGAAGVMASPFGIADQGLQVIDNAAAALTGTPRRKIAGAPGPEGFLLDLAGQADRTAKGLSPPSTDLLQSGISSGVQSLTQNVMGLMSGNPTLALGSMVAGAGGQSYAKAREKGVSAGTAAVYGASDAVVEWATEKVPVGRLFADLKAGTPLFSTLWRQAVAEVPGEQVATLLQDLNEWAVLNSDKPFSDYLKERPAAAAQTLIATLVGVGGNVAVMRTVQNTMDTAAGVDRRAEALADLMRAAGQSKTRERDPQGFADFVQKAARDTGAPADVFIDVKAFGEVLAQSGVTPEQISAALPSITDQLNEAIATGGDLVIPVGELAAGIAGSPLEQLLMQHVRTSPDALSKAEAKNTADEKQLRAIAEQIFDEQSTDQADTTSRDAVRKIVLEELNKAGRFTPDVNAAYADLTAQFFATQAARMGTTAEALAAQYPLKVRNAATQGEVLQQYAETAPILAATRPVTMDGIRALVDGKTEKPGGTNPLLHVNERDSYRVGDVPLALFVDNEEGDRYDGTVNPARAQDYASRNPVGAPPVIATQGRRDGKLRIIDGGHRISAARLRGDTTIPAIVRVRDPELKQDTPAKPSPETIELRKREKVLQRLLECLT